MQYPKPARVPNEIDWARLAAFIDGEGYIGVTKPNGQKKTYLELKVTNTNMKLIDWLGNTFGGGAYVNWQSAKAITKWAKAYRWQPSQVLAVEILKGCLPYLIIKKDQAELAILHQELVGQKRREKSARVTEESLEMRLYIRDELSMLKGTNSRRKDLRDQPAVQ